MRAVSGNPAAESLHPVALSPSRTHAHTPKKMIDAAALNIDESTYNDKKKNIPPLAAKLQAVRKERLWCSLKEFSEGEKATWMDLDRCSNITIPPCTHAERKQQQNKQSELSIVRRHKITQ